MLASDSDNAIGKGAIETEAPCRCFSLAEIQSATNNFDDKMVVGIGGFGKVYKGFIDDGSTTVAIKRLNPESKQGAGEFWTEVMMLSKLRHTHLVTLIGYCNDCNEMILVYEYIARGTLADHIYKISPKGGGIDLTWEQRLNIYIGAARGTLGDHLYKISPKGDGIGLTWKQRLNICIGAARGLDYIHTGSDQSFIHRDVKTTNILLDEKWVAKISDFGLSKGTTSHSATHVSTAVKGTFGYLDPDYFLTQRLTQKSDVYAFGVVMLEVLCGRPAVDIKREEEQISLVLWAQPCIKKGRPDRIIDPSLKGEISPNSLKCFVEVVNKCLLDRPQGRPTMAEVVTSLEFVLALQQKATIDDDRLHPTKKKGFRHSLKKRFETSIDSATESFRSSLPNNVEFRIGYVGINLELGKSKYHE